MLEQEIQPLLTETYNEISNIRLDLDYDVLTIEQLSKVLRGLDQVYTTLYKLSPEQAPKLGYRFKIRKPHLEIVDVQRKNPLSFVFNILGGVGIVSFSLVSLAKVIEKIVHIRKEWWEGTGKKFDAKLKEMEYKEKKEAIKRNIDLMGNEKLENKLITRIDSFIDTLEKQTSIRSVVLGGIRIYENGTKSKS